MNKDRVKCFLNNMYCFFGSTSITLGTAVSYVGRINNNESLIELGVIGMIAGSVALIGTEWGNNTYQAYLKARRELNKPRSEINVKVLEDLTDTYCKRTGLRIIAEEKNLENFVEDIIEKNRYRL